MTISDEINDLLDTHCADAFALHAYLSKKPPKPNGTVSFTNLATSYLWAAELAENLAQNNSNIRTAIRQHDQIVEQEIWPDPDSIVALDENDFLNTIKYWLQINNTLFTGLLKIFYKNAAGVSYSPCHCLHDCLNRLAVNAVEFIKAQNGFKWPNGYALDPIDYVEVPGPPEEEVGDGTRYQSLRRLERAIHKLVQDRMQIASFIPAHLRWQQTHGVRLK